MRYEDYNLAPRIGRSVLTLLLSFLNGEREEFPALADISLLARVSFDLVSKEGTVTFTRKEPSR